MDDCHSLEALRGVIRKLLGPDGCPWDKEQTPESLCDYVIEEAFELVSAIRADDTAEACEELGDVMFLLLFVAELFERAERFTLSRAMRESAAKMIRRHPHVFAGLDLEDAGEIFTNWEKIKREEKNADTSDGERPKGVFHSLPTGLPPMLKAYRLHSKAARTGFTWDSDEEMAAGLDQEWKEWEQARASGDAERMQEEFGDYLFSLVEYGRRHGLKANAALDLANMKFLGRFEAMERLAFERGLDFANLSAGEKNTLWDEVKAAGATRK